MSTERDRLQGWKEIASFLGRDERTAKRWEKQRGLPVRRIPGAGRASVYVMTAELEDWLATGPGPSALIENAGEAEELEEEAVDVREQTPPVVAIPEDVGWWRRGLWLGASVAAGVLLVVGVQGARGIRRGEKAAAAEIRSGGYRSPKAGVDELYLQAVYFYEKRTPASLESARKMFTDVIARDAKDAPAYAGLAETYLMEREYATMTPAEAYTRARDAAGHALKLDPTLAEAHSVMGFIDFFSDFNPRAATEQFQTALKLDPNCVLAHHWYGSMLTHQGLYAKGLAELTIAERLEPRSAAVISSRAYALGLSGQRSEALRVLHRIMEMAPREPSPPRIVARLELQPPRDLDGYFDGLLKFEQVRNDVSERREVEEDRESFHRSGEKAMWEGIVAREQAKGFSAARPSYAMAEAEAQLGQREEALAMLTILAERHDVSILGTRMNPLFVEMRGDARFQKLLADVGLNGG